MNQRGIGVGNSCEPVAGEGLEERANIGGVEWSDPCSNIVDGCRIKNCHEGCPCCEIVQQVMSRRLEAVSAYQKAESLRAREAS